MWLMPLNLDPYLSEPLQRSVIPALVTAAIALIGRWLSPRSRMKWGVSHGFVFGVPQVAAAPPPGAAPTPAPPPGAAPTPAPPPGAAPTPAPPPGAAPTPAPPPGIAQYHTRTVFVQNVGRATAELVEVHFNYTPEHMQIWPTLNYESATNAENRFTVMVANLGPREYFTLELLSTRTLPDVLRIRSKAGEGRQVAIAPSEVLLPWVRRLIIVLLWLGGFAIIQNLYLWFVR
jgi:hypothetical protein